jgi:deoxyribodipyrimidine photo-lyase
MSDTSSIIVWFRADLRLHDHPALVAAVKAAATVVPVFIFNDALLRGSMAGANRNRFLLESLADLKASLKEIGGDLVIRHGDAADELQKLAEETGAKAVYYTADYTPWAIKRDTEVEQSLQSHNIEARSFGGKLAVSALPKLQTKSGSPFKVFTPFWKAWSQVTRREIVAPPKRLSLPKLAIGRLPSADSLIDTGLLSDDVIKGGETEARRRLTDFLDGPIDDYHTVNNDMATDGTSRLSAYLHFGCLSVREIETMLPDSQGARAWHRQLAWRDFYYYVLFHFPHPEREFQERYRQFAWETDAKRLTAWQEGRTGYPVVDAAMRQLKAEGWMHNRARLIVGSFLTKDLGIDWREGERHFMRWLVDGDMANNNGNWQWIASVGVDPAPVFRRLYNPASQRDRYDPTGAYVRKYVPELQSVPDKYLSEPWTMPVDMQKDVGCVIGSDYPEPIVDHKQARELALQRYRSV